MTETFKQHVARIVGEEKDRLYVYDWSTDADDTIRKAFIAATSTADPRLYYLVRYYPHAAQHDYYLVRSGNTRVELPNYRYPDAQWTWDECERVDPEHKYKRVLVEDR